MKEEIIKNLNVSEFTEKKHIEKETAILKNTELKKKIIELQKLKIKHEIEKEEKLSEATLEATKRILTSKFKTKKKLEAFIKKQQGSVIGTTAAAAINSVIEGIKLSPGQGAVTFGQTMGQELAKLCVTLGAEIVGRWINTHISNEVHLQSATSLLTDMINHVTQDNPGLYDAAREQYIKKIEAIGGLGKLNSFGKTFIAHMKIAKDFEDTELHNYLSLRYKEALRKKSATPFKQFAKEQFYKSKECDVDLEALNIDKNKTLTFKSLLSR